MKKYIQSFWMALLSLWLAGVLCACAEDGAEKEAGQKWPPDSKVEIYENNGLKLSYLANWSLLHDEPGVIADRTVAFETDETSRITIYFYKNSPRSAFDISSSLVEQLDLANSEDVQNFQENLVEVGGFKGVRLAWKNLGLSETLNEVTVLQIRASPFPVFAQFQFFDEEIQSLNSIMLPFALGIAFDPQGVKL